MSRKSELLTIMSINPDIHVHFPLPGKHVCCDEGNQVNNQRLSLPALYLIGPTLHYPASKGENN